MCGDDFRLLPSQRHSKDLPSHGVTQLSLLHVLSVPLQDLLPQGTVVVLPDSLDHGLRRIVKLHDPDPTAEVFRLEQLLGYSERRLRSLVVKLGTVFSHAMSLKLNHSGVSIVRGNDSRWGSSGRLSEAFAELCKVFHVRLFLNGVVSRDVPFEEWKRLSRLTVWIPATGNTLLSGLTVVQWTSSLTLAKKAGKSSWAKGAQSSSTAARFIGILVQWI